MKAPTNFNNTEIAFAHKSNLDLRRSHWIYQLIGNNTLVKWSNALATWAIKVGLPLRPFVKPTVFWQFCAGENLEECRKTAQSLAESDVKVILNFGIEGKEDEADFDRVTNSNIKLLRFCAEVPNITSVAIKLTALGRHALFEKVQLGEELNQSEKEEYARIVHRTDLICQAAVAAKIDLMVDAEESWIQDTIDQLVDTMMARYNVGEVRIMNTFQIYRHDRFAFLKASHEKAQRGGYLIGAKVVRGAYMEKERGRAVKLHYASPIHQNKTSVDVDYDEAIAYCLDHLEEIKFCAASHNEASCLKLATQVEQRGIAPDHEHISIAQLYGMGDHITYNLADCGFNATKFIPFGPVKEVVPYLIRRANENTSVAGQMNRETDMLVREIARRKQ